MQNLFSDQNSDWEVLFRKKIYELHQNIDPAHDFSHFTRVSIVAKKICKLESAKMEIVVPAAWLHDFVNIPKNDPLRAEASKISAQAAIQYLKEIDYPSQYFDGIKHAIEAHSFSAGIRPQTLEAQVVQDADRLDGLGAIGIARCFSLTSILKGQFYHPTDPFAQDRELNDSRYSLDHFYKKLFKIAETLQTQAGKEEGLRRVQFMQTFIEQLKSEIEIEKDPYKLDHSSF